MYTQPPPQGIVEMYGNDIGDFLPEIEISSATNEIYGAFSALGTQWRISPSGHVVGLEYASIPFVLDALGITDKEQALRDLRWMESAALAEINKGEA